MPSYIPNLLLKNEPHPKLAATPPIPSNSLSICLKYNIEVLKFLKWKIISNYFYAYVIQKSDTIIITVVFSVPYDGYFETDEMNEILTPENSNLEIVHDARITHNI